MENEIVYVCNSINNKNVRGNELKILRKKEKELCFEFGESEVNIKRRYYKNEEELNKDFEEVKKIKTDIESNEKEINEKEINEKEKTELDNNEKQDESFDIKKNRNKDYHKNNLF